MSNGCGFSAVFPALPDFAESKALKTEGEAWLPLLACLCYMSWLSMSSLIGLERTVTFLYFSSGWRGFQKYLWRR